MSALSGLNSPLRDVQVQARSAEPLSVLEASNEPLCQDVVIVHPVPPLSGDSARAERTAVVQDRLTAREPHDVRRAKNVRRAKSKIIASLKRLGVSPKTIEDHLVLLKGQIVEEGIATNNRAASRKWGVSHDTVRGWRKTIFRLGRESLRSATRVITYNAFFRISIKILQEVKKRIVNEREHTTTSIAATNALRSFSDLPIRDPSQGGHAPARRPPIPQEREPAFAGINTLATAAATASSAQLSQNKDSSTARPGSVPAVRSKRKKRSPQRLRVSHTSARTYEPAPLAVQVIDKVVKGKKN